MDEKTKEAVEQSIVHWSRMIEWAKKQDPFAEVDACDMDGGIREWWTGDYCSLCQLAENLSSVDDEIEYENDCECCILFKSNNGCQEPGSKWLSVEHSRTWGDWVISAEAMLQTLKELS
jgi:hypothetical protein